MWDQGSKGWNQGSEGWDLRSQPLDQGSQAMRSGSAVFLRAQLKDQTVPFLWDQGSKFVTLFESGIRNLGTEMGSAMKKHTSLPPYSHHYTAVLQRYTYTLVFSIQWGLNQRIAIIYTLVDLWSLSLACMAFAEQLE